MPHDSRKMHFILSRQAEILDSALFSEALFEALASNMNARTALSSILAKRHTRALTKDERRLVDAAEKEARRLAEIDLGVPE